MREAGKGGREGGGKGGREGGVQARFLSQRPLAAYARACRLFTGRCERRPLAARGGLSQRAASSSHNIYPVPLLACPNPAAPTRRVPARLRCVPQLPWSRVELIHRRASEVCRRFEHVNFIIGGDGPMRVALEQMRENHQLQVPPTNPPPLSDTLPPISSSRLNPPQRHSRMRHRQPLSARRSGFPVHPAGRGGQ